MQNSKKKKLSIYLLNLLSRKEKQTKPPRPPNKKVLRKSCFFSLSMMLMQTLLWIRSQIYKLK